MPILMTPFKAIADDTRRRILDLLREDSLTAGAIAERFRKISRPAVSKHLAILRRSHLVTARKQGRERVYALDAGPLHEVQAWLQQYEALWDQQLKSFKDYVESGSGKESLDDEEG